MDEYRAPRHTSLVFVKTYYLLKREHNVSTRVRDEQSRYFEIWLNILDLAFRAREIYERRTPEEKRLLLSHIFSNLTLTGGNVAYTLKSPVQKVFERVQQRLDSENTFEPIKHRAYNGEKDPFESLSPALRAHQESDLGCRFWRPMYYHYTMDPCFAALGAAISLA